MEKEYKISWLKVIGVAVIILLIIGLVLFFSKKSNKGDLENRIFIENIEDMKEAGFLYFQGSNLPKEVGDSKLLSLEELIDAKLMIEFKDYQGKACNLKDSYVKVTKTLDNEYAMKVNLVCDTRSDYILSTISNEKAVCVSCNEDENSNNNVNTSNNTNNSNNSNNSNNNSSNSSNSSNNKPVQQIVKYNINYVNSCNCSATNCGNCQNNVYYSVYFEVNGGDNYIPKQTIKAGTTANYVVAYRAGYRFLGWYTDKELTLAYDFNTPVVTTLTLYAKWEKLTSGSTLKYTVNFDSNGGSSVSSQVVSDGNYASRPKDPTRSCYTFLGWYLNGVRYDFNTPVKGDITLEAKWEEDGSCNTKQYLVEFNSNGGSSVKSEIVNEGEKATEIIPTKACYSFVAWHINSLNGPVYNFNNRVYNNLYLVAEWVYDNSCVNDYTISFDANGGSFVANQIVMEGYRAKEPKVPVRSGYVFKGWYYNNYLFDFNTRIYHNYNLVAKWEKEQVQYHTYCKINTDTYYSVSYVGDSKQSKGGAWTIKFDNIKNAQNLKVTKTGYLNTLSDYNKAYTKVYTNKGISMVGSDGSGDVPFTSGAMLRQYSLKQGNFVPYVNYPYYSKGVWYMDIQVAVNNYNNATSYYVVRDKKGIYFIPFYFNVEYTDLNNCINDKASNASKYTNYEIVDTFYR